MKKALGRSLLPFIRGAAVAAERWRLRKPAAPRHVPTFIIGPPRSGTTVLYQLMTQSCDVAYLANVTTLVPEAPVTLTHLLRRRLRAHRSDFQSRHGQTEGWGGPNEGAAFWYRWFPRDAIGMDGSELSEAAREECIRSVAGLERVLGAPFVNKNVMHAVRMRALDSLFPGCLFLVLERDPVDVAASILRARQADGVTDADWWSAKPRRFPQIAGLPVVERTCEQVYWLEHDVSEDAAALGPGRVHRVAYARVCSEPEAVLTEIAAFARAAGLHFDRRGPVPETLQAPGCRTLDPALREELCRVAAERFGGDPRVGAVGRP